MAKAIELPPIILATRGDQAATRERYIAILNMDEHLPIMNIEDQSSLWVDGLNTVAYQSHLRMDGRPKLPIGGRFKH